MAFNFIKFLVDADLNGNKLLNVADGTAGSDGVNLDQVNLLINNAIAGGVQFQGEYNAGTNTPDLETPAPGAVAVGDMWVVSVGGSFFTETLQPGDTIIAKVNDPSALTEWVRVERNTDVETLAQTLAAGNTTGANDILVDANQNVTWGGIASSSSDGTDFWLFRGGTVGLFGYLQLTAVSADLFFKTTGVSAADLAINFDISGTNKAILNANELHLTNGADLLLSDDSRIIYTVGANQGILDHLALTGTRTWSLPDASGTIALLSDIPAVPDEVQSYPNLAGFPATGTAEVIYIAEDTGLLYRWDGAAYVQVGGDAGGGENLAQTLAIGNNSGTNDIVMANNQKISFGSAGGNIQGIDDDIYITSAFGPGNPIISLITGVLASFQYDNNNRIDVKSSGTEIYAVEGALKHVFDNDHTIKVGALKIDTISGVNGEIIFGTTNFNQLNSPAANNYNWSLPADSGTLALVGDIAGAVNFTVQILATALDSPYTPSDREILYIDASGGNFTVNLPAAALSENYHIFVKKTDASANTVTIDGNGAEVIDGATTYTLTAQNEVIELYCDGGEWIILASHNTPTGAAALEQKSGVIASGSFAPGSPRKATVNFSTAFPDNNYAVTITSEDSRTFTIESKTAAGFTVNSNSASALSGNTFWIAMAAGES